MNCLPKFGRPNIQTSQKGIPGWNEYVKPFQDESLFWHSLWRAAGKPDHEDFLPFDPIAWKKLFPELLERNISPLLL